MTRTKTTARPTRAAADPVRRIRRYQASAHVAARPEEVFARLDDPTSLGRHMVQRSAMMGGGRMTYDFDKSRGQAVGSHIKMGGKAFGVKLFVDEVVSEREPPRRKVWRTVGKPELLIIDSYEMGLEITPERSGSRVRVWINYELPKTLLGRLAGPGLGAAYARWCVGRMVADAAGAFRQNA